MQVEDAGRKKLRDAAQAAAAEVQSLQDSILELQVLLPCGSIPVILTAHCMSNGEFTSVDIY